MCFEVNKDTRKARKSDLFFALRFPLKNFAPLLLRAFALKTRSAREAGGDEAQDDVFRFPLKNFAALPLCPFALKTRSAGEAGGDEAQDDVFRFPLKICAFALKTRSAGEAGGDEARDDVAQGFTINRE